MGGLYTTYKFLTQRSAPLLQALLRRRVARDKEDPARLSERKGRATLKRPKGDIIWIHAASVGESQSALILVNKILSTMKNVHVLVTTGTRTSADIMSKNLPQKALHQYYPLDHPAWVDAFLDHWSPTAALWMESELWPNMLRAVKSRGIAAALVNARLSDASYKKWRLFKKTARDILDTFHIVLCQNAIDKHRFEALGVAADAVHVTDNLKYSAAPLSYDADDLKRLSGHILNRPVWVFASTHDGEERLACHVHEIVKNALPDLLTIIVPRHPHRRDDIAADCDAYILNTVFRGDDHEMPRADTDIYVADTMGELGLFYRLAPLACIGRSFSRDGGGGHNPIEAAQLGCAVLYGPNVQYQQQIFDAMTNADAALQIKSPEYLIETVRTFLTEDTFLHAQQKRGQDFAVTKTAVIERVWTHLEILFLNAGFNIQLTHTSNNHDPKPDNGTHHDD